MSITIKNKKSSIDELLNLYMDIRDFYTDNLKDLKTNYSITDHNKDVRTCTLMLSVENIQTNIIILNLIKEGFENLKLWDNQTFSSQKDKEGFLNNRLYFITNDIREGLFVNLFLRFEHYIRIISKHLKLDSSKAVNPLTRELILKLTLNSDYNNFINLLTYIRNTIHNGGFHTKNTQTITYKNKNYTFNQNAPITFYDEDFLKFLSSEINDFMKDINNNDDIKSENLILHDYSILKFDYE